MELKRNGSQPSAKGPAENFTGNVRVDLLFQSPGPAQFNGALVTFEPGARTAADNPNPSLFQIIDEVERRIIVVMLERTGWNQTEAA